MPTIESLLSIPQTARLIGLSPRTLWRMVAEAKTPEPVRIGRAVRLRASEVNRWIELGCPDRAGFNAGQRGRRL